MALGPLMIILNGHRGKNGLGDCFHSYDCVLMGLMSMPIVLYRQQGSLLELLGILTWSVSTSSSQHSPHLLWMCMALHTYRAQS